MKNFSFTFALVILCVAIPRLGLGQVIQEQEDRGEMRNIDRAHDRILKIHPLHYGEIFVSYEKVRTPDVSNEFGLSYLYKLHMKGEGWSTNMKDVMGIGVRMSQRHYPSKKLRAPFGFFHGPMFQYRFIVFERNVFDLPPEEMQARYIGRMYQNVLDLSYHLGYQFQLGRHFTTELSGGLGARAKFGIARNGGELMQNIMIGHVVRADEGSVLTVGPSPQLNFAIGYSF